MLTFHLAPVTQVIVASFTNEAQPSVFLPSVREPVHRVERQEVTCRMQVRVYTARGFHMKQRCSIQIPLSSILSFMNLCSSGEHQSTLASAQRILARNLPKHIECIRTALTRCFVTLAVSSPTQDARTFLFKFVSTTSSY